MSSARLLFVALAVAVQSLTAQYLPASRACGCGCQPPVALSTISLVQETLVYPPGSVVVAQPSCGCNSSPCGCSNSYASTRSCGCNANPCGCDSCSCNNSPCSCNQELILPPPFAQLPCGCGFSEAAVPLVASAYGSNPCSCGGTFIEPYYTSACGCGSDNCGCGYTDPLVAISLSGNGGCGCGCGYPGYGVPAISYALPSCGCGTANGCGCGNANTCGCGGVNGYGYGGANSYGYGGLNGCGCGASSCGCGGGCGCGLTLATPVCPNLACLAKPIIL